jgi:hypothetical protein
MTFNAQLIVMDRTETSMDQNEPIERNLGEQPIARVMADAGIKPHDLVAASTVPMTHKMVARACKGRRLTLNTQTIVLKALQAATGKSFTLDELFTYR